MDEEINALTRRIIGLAMRVHTRLGPGLLGQAYKHCLCHELDVVSIPYQAEIDLPLIYDGTRLDCGYRADVIVASQVILELKSVEHITPLHEAQLLTYLRLSGCRAGLLLNFNVVALKEGIRRRGAVKRRPAVNVGARFGRWAIIHVSPLPILDVRSTIG